MTVLAEMCRDAAEAIETGRDGRFTWFGEHPAPLTPERVADRLYHDWYRRGGAAPHDHDPRPPLDGAGGSVGSAVAAAVSRTTAVQGGWTVAGDVAERGGLRLRVAPDDLAGPGEVVLPAHMPHLAPGYHLVLGARDLDGSPTRRVRRTYLHLRAGTAAAVVARLVDALDDAGVAFRVKCLDSAHAYVRCDAGVLFTRAEDDAAVTPLVDVVLDGAPGALRPQTPRLAHPRRAGVGEADDPGGGDSFGGHRCRLVARGLVEAHSRGARDVAARLAHVERVFGAEGLDADAPHRAPPDR